MRDCIHGGIQPSLPITQTLSGAQHIAAMRDCSFQHSQRLMQSRCVGMKIQSQTVILLLFLVSFGWFFSPLFLCFRSIQAKFSISCLCISRAEHNYRGKQSPVG